MSKVNTQTTSYMICSQFLFLFTPKGHTIFAYKAMSLLNQCLIELFPVSECALQTKSRQMAYKSSSDPFGPDVFLLSNCLHFSANQQ